MSDNQTFKDRLIILISKLGYSIRAFEQKIGVSNGYINSMRKGMNSDKLHNLEKAFPQINTSWLFTGEGEMLKDSVDCTVPINNEETNLTQLIAKLTQENRDLKKQLADKDEMTSKLMQIQENLSKTLELVMKSRELEEKMNKK